MFLSKAVVFLISPLTLALLLVCLGLICLLRDRKHLATCFISLALVWLCFWSLPVTSHWLYALVSKEYPYRAAASFAKAEAIVVLGGGVKPANTLHPEPDIGNSADRVWFASQLFHAGKAPLLVLSGLLPDGSLYSEAHAMRMLMLDLGVPDNAMISEGASINTQQNAAYTHRLLQRRGVHRILLVTSALHMKRAAAEFIQQGFEVTPAATDYRLEPAVGLRPYIPDASALLDNTGALKEVIGQLVLHWKYA